MYQKTTLDNGLRILTATMPHTHSVAVAFYIGAGSRYEDDLHGGVSHYLEHMLFKGTPQHPTGRDISSTIESVGGILNAGTDRELTTYWAKVARPHFQRAIDLLVDMLLNPLLDPQELERERLVVQEELSMTNDDPTYRVETLIDEVLWPNQPMGRDVGGSKESVRGITREMMVDYMTHQYTPTNTVLCVVGNISHDEVVSEVVRSLTSWSAGTPLAWYPAVDSQNLPQMKLEHRKTDEAHLCMAVKGLPANHPDRYALTLINAVLGGGMSSRLFVELREKQGLAYAVHSSSNHFKDCGYVNIYTGVNPKRVDQAINIILEELHRLWDGVPEEELQNAKELVKGRLLLRMEDTRAVVGWLGTQELLLGEILTPEEVVERVQSTTPQDVKRVARELLVTEKLNLAVVGPYRAESRFQRILKL